MRATPATMATIAPYMPGAMVAAIALPASYVNAAMKTPLVPLDLDLPPLHPQHLPFPPKAGQALITITQLSKQSFGVARYAIRYQHPSRL